MGKNVSLPETDKYFIMLEKIFVALYSLDFCCYRETDIVASGETIFRLFSNYFFNFLFLFFLNFSIFVYIYNSFIIFYFLLLLLYELYN